MQKRLSRHPQHARHIWRWLENQCWTFMFPSPLRIYLPASSSSHVHYVNWSWKKELGLSTLEASNCRKSTPHNFQPAYAVPFHIEIYEAKDLCINSSYGCTGSWISSITSSPTPLRAPSYYQHHLFPSAICSPSMSFHIYRGPTDGTLFDAYIHHTNNRGTSFLMQ